jgi:hypothetical protein
MNVFFLSSFHELSACGPTDNADGLEGMSPGAGLLELGASP